MDLTISSKGGTSRFTANRTHDTKVMENYSQAVTFGRFNLPHPGHVHLIKKMLKECSNAYVAISLGKNNNDVHLRRYVIERLCELEGLDTTKIDFFGSANPYSAVEFMTNDVMTRQTNPELLNKTTVVFGVDQTKLGERLRDDLGVKFVPNKVRVGSSTVIRYFLEQGDEKTVREIYHEDSELFTAVRVLRSEELAREKS